jgi:hypothetical protein
MTIKYNKLLFTHQQQPTDIKPTHVYTHQTTNVHCIKPTELTTESY